MKTSLENERAQNADSGMEWENHPEAVRVIPLSGAVIKFFRWFGFELKNLVSQRESDFATFQENGAM